MLLDRRRISRRPPDRQPQGAARRRLRRDLRRLRRAARTRLEIPGRREAAERIHIGIDWLSTFRSATSVDRQAGDRARRRQYGDGLLPLVARLGGEEIKVIVRSGFAEMKASPWEKEDAMREGIEILNFLGRRRSRMKADRLTGVVFEKLGRVGRTRAPDTRRRRRAGRTYPCDDVLIAVGQETPFPGSRGTSGRLRSRACRGRPSDF